MNTPTVSARLPGVGSLIELAMSQYQARFKTYLGISVIAWIIPTLLAIFLSPTPSAAASNLGAGDTVLGIITLLVYLVMGSIGAAALLYAITRGQESPNISTAYRRGFAWAAAYLWVSVLSGIIVIAGFILLIIPGIIFAVWFSLCGFVVVNENLRGWTALKKSKHYVQGFWWPVFGRLLVIIIITGVISGVVGAVFGMAHSSLISALASAAVTVLITPFLTLYSWLIYQALRQRKAEVVSPA